MADLPINGLPAPGVAPVLPMIACVFAPAVSESVHQDETHETKGKSYGTRYVCDDFR